MLTSIRFSVPLIPPSVNHYKGTHRGRYFVRDEATAFKHAVALCAQGQQIDAKRVAINITLFLGKGDRGDVDNYPKCVLDGLKGCVVKSDASFKRMTVELERDWLNPRTEIELSALPDLVKARRR
jgi:Holliday junction resolvase RusA-like endonuclease